MLEAFGFVVSFSEWVQIPNMLPCESQSVATLVHDSCQSKVLEFDVQIYLVNILG